LLRFICETSKSRLPSESTSLFFAKKFYITPAEKSIVRQNENRMEKLNIIYESFLKVKRKIFSKLLTGGNFCSIIAAT